jgi:threonine/homoserine/homoserine lactone efflux protein
MGHHDPVSIAFLVTTLVIVATPGTGALYTIAAVMHTSAVAFNTIKYAGVVYLVYLAWQTWRDRSLLTVDTPTVDDAPARPSGPSSAPLWPSTCSTPS